MPVRIVTDSTADMPPDLAKRWGISVIPLKVHFGDEVYSDGVDITSDQFFEKLVTSRVHPSTSQPSVGEFLELYKGLSADGSPIVSIHISDKLSGTMNSARQAKEAMGPAARIKVIDTTQASMGIGIVALEAAKAAKAGASFEDVVARAKAIIPRVQIYFVVDTLEYLAKGGRIGKAQAFLGNLLSVKPVLVVKDGEVGPLERVRTRDRALARLIELAEAEKPIASAVVLHATTPKDAEMLKENLQKLVQPGGEVLVTHFGAVIGTHAGPGTIGFAVVRAT